MFVGANKKIYFRFANSQGSFQSATYTILLCFLYESLEKLSANTHDMNATLWRSFGSASRTCRGLFWEFMSLIFGKEWKETLEKRNGKGFASFSHIFLLIQEALKTEKKRLRNEMVEWNFPRNCLWSFSKLRKKFPKN